MAQDGIEMVIISFLLGTVVGMVLTVCVVIGKDK